MRELLVIGGMVRRGRESDSEFAGFVVGGSVDAGVGPGVGAPREG